MFRRIILSSVFLSVLGLQADEGMWTFGHPPQQAMAARYGFAPDQAWLDHLRLATVVFGGEGTGCLVGREGLVLTNQHLAHPCLQKASEPRRDLVQDGFVARSRTQELPVPGLELRVLVAMKDITARVRQAVQTGMSHQEAEAALGEVKRGETGGDGLAWELVDFFGGGEYWLYGYRSFRDVRLVMAPEFDIAAFGKDWDNFAYPRHDLDFSLFRVYEDGRPYRPEHALVCSRKGISSGGMTLVAGHPGRTNRQEPWARMEYRHRVENPLVVQTLERTFVTLKAFAARSAANARRVSADLAETANFLKVYREETRSLGAPEFRLGILAQEKQLRSRIDRDPKWRRQAGPSWEASVRLLRQLEPLAREYQLMHRSHASLERGPLSRALQLVRRVSGVGPGDASPGGSDGACPPESLDANPMNRELETALLASGLAEARVWLGKAHPLVRALLGDQEPEEVARQAILDTRIDDPAFVRGLLAGGRQVLSGCQDPLLRLAMKLDPHSRETAARYEALDAQLREHLARIAQARHALGEPMSYPEADFTLRLSYGSVAPYPADGTLQPPFTTFGGLFDRADAWGPSAEEGSWALPPRWLQRRKALDPSVPLDFITTNDITGGSSGSPVVDRHGELVGLVFDGNFGSIPGRFNYDERRNRCIAVDVRAILEALAKVYDADFLVQELTAR